MTGTDALSLLLVCIMSYHVNVLMQLQGSLFRKKNHASMVGAAFVLRRAQLIIMREPFYIMATDLYQTKIYNKAIILFFSRGWGAEGEGMRIDPHLLN